MASTKSTSDLPVEASRSVARVGGFIGTLQRFFSTPIPVRCWFLSKNKGRDMLRRVPNSEASANRKRSSASLPFHDRLEVHNPLALAL